MANIEVTFIIFFDESFSTWNSMNERKSNTNLMSCDSSGEDH